MLEVVTLVALWATVVVAALLEVAGAEAWVEDAATAADELAATRVDVGAAAAAELDLGTLMSTPLARHRASALVTAAGRMLARCLRPSGRGVRTGKVGASAGAGNAAADGADEEGALAVAGQVGDGALGRVAGVGSEEAGKLLAVSNRGLEAGCWEYSQRRWGCQPG